MEVAGSSAGLEQRAYFFSPGSENDDASDKYKLEELKASEKPEAPREPESSIELNAWKPDVPYLKTLAKVAANERMSKYFALKKQYSQQPSFFVDVARFFIEGNEKKIGLQILSNVSEMKLENPELLRLVGNQLLEAGEKELAVETFKQVLEMKEEDPQSYRDLALAYNEIAEYNKSIDLLYKLVTGIWDGRFGDVKGIALNEMNAIISAHTGSVNTAAIDKRLIFAMPVDVRIVVGWNTDNSDVDLWVTDPLKEKCFYEHTETAIGGRISRDVTQGYGPEEYSLKKAANGEYSIEVNLYGDTRENLGGPIAIKAELFTDFGKATQKRKMINLRVVENKEVVKIGSLSFGS
jgi:tetratricopeptide (TPR) repeat protein